MNKTILIIILMAVVTYIPRALPVFIMKYIKLNKRAEQFLKLIPYTAMGVLIFPGILSVDQSSIIVGIVGGMVAVLFSWRFHKITLTILSSVLSVMLVYLMI